MQPKLRKLVRFGSLAALTFLAASFFDPSRAHAEIDNFGVGNGHNGAKTVAGEETINAYAALAQDAALGTTQLTITATTIGNPIGFENGDLVLLWRATGVLASEAPSGNQTKRLNLSTALSDPANSGAGAVGTFEFARVASLAGSVLTLTKPLTQAFAKNVTQVVKVPEYSTVNIPNGTSIRATAWQEIGGNPATPDPTKPWAGGIVIFFATGAITNNGTIHANARGFHGATPTQRLLTLGLNCDTANMDGDSANGPYSPKGEGVVQSRFTAATGGKGNVSMAGGGGNCLESGGGGGANVGNGGAGSATALNLGSGGLGGVGIDYDLLTRMSMGGGGGAGRHNIGVGLLNSSVSFGGWGGGVVYVRGLSLAGTTGRIQANGGNGEDSGILNLPSGVASQGSGGGGAGGTIIVRLAGTLECDAIGVPGGNGGSAQVAGLPVFGAGGGGGGGRVLFQAQSKSNDCDIVITPGSPGNGGQGGSQGGGQGSTTNPPGGLCIPGASQGTPGECVDPIPVCDPVTGSCVKCTGPFGGGSPRACQVNIEPVCMVDGSCVPCNGDFASGTTQACQLAGQPYCFTTGAANVIGSCGKCTTNTDCTTGNHPGPICNVQSGSCGKACTKDEDCLQTEWCAPRAADGTNVCTPKTPNSQPVPPYPPIDGECTPAKGQRVCLSAVCEESDDQCGLKNSSPCRTDGECRSDVCFPNDKLCGLPNGEPCTTNEKCRSEQCKEGVCVGPCDDDRECKLGQICEGPTGNKTCIEGCRPGVRLVDGGQAHGGCPEGQDCVLIATPDGGGGDPIGKCQPSSDAGYGGTPLPPFDAGDTAGIVEGGGCSCNTALSASASPFAVLGAALSATLLARRRKSKR